MRKYIFLIFLFFSCKNPSDKRSVNKFIEDSLQTSFDQKRFGNSNLYISLPIEYSLREKKGSDYWVMYFSKTDSSIKNEFLVGMYSGDLPYEFVPKKGQCLADVIKGEVLKDSIEWIVYNCNGEYLIQTVIENKKGEGFKDALHFFGLGKSNSELNKMMQVYSTLVRK